MRNGIKRFAVIAKRASCAAMRLPGTLPASIPLVRAGFGKGALALVRSAMPSEARHHRLRKGLALDLCEGWG